MFYENTQQEKTVNYFHTTVHMEMKKLHLCFLVCFSLIEFFVILKLYIGNNKARPST